MTRGELVDAIISEVERVWPEDGFGGSREEYDWLLAHYGITENEDCQWIDVREWESGELEASWAELPVGEEDLASREQERQFLVNDQAVCEFLAQFLQKYRSNDAQYAQTT